MCGGDRAHRGTASRGWGQEARRCAHSPSSRGSGTPARLNSANGAASSVGLDHTSGRRDRVKGVYGEPRPGEGRLAGGRARSGRCGGRADPVRAAADPDRHGRRGLRHRHSHSHSHRHRHRRGARVAGGPLCGTLNYAVGTALVAVNVALCDGRDTPLAPTAATRLVDVNLDAPFPGAPAVSHSGPAPAADGRADRVEDAPLRAARPGNGHVAASFASRRRNADVSVGDGHRLRREYG